MTDEAVTAMHQQFTATLEGLGRQKWNCRLSWHRADSKRRMSFKHSDRKSEVLHCVGRRRRESGVDAFAGEAKRLLRSARRVAKGYAGAAIPRLQKLMDNAAKATEPDFERHDLG